MAATKRSGAAGLTIALAFAISAGAGLALCTARAQGDDKPAAEALKPFQGSWATDGEGIDSKWTFEGENLKATVNGQDYTCKVTADPAAKPNGTLDMTISDGPEDSKGKISKAIFKFDGEKLTLCVSFPGKDRPKDFAQIDDEAYLFVLKKQK
jgi:uncharacterized protein (TIGR03067 family)